MTDPYFQELFARRIGGANYGKGTEIYKFEKIKRAKRKALAEHPERKLLDFGIGENDEMADPSVRRVMAEEIDKPENRGYADNGILEFKEAAARLMAREFGVELDPVTEINHCIGTKTALAMLPAAFIDPGDVTLMTVPGYPVAGTHTKYYGGEVYRLPLRAENDFLPDLDSIPADILRRAKLLVLELSEQPDRQGGHAGVLRAGRRFRPDEPHRRHPRRDTHHAQLRRSAAEFSASAGGPRGGRRGPFDLEGLEHDRLAAGLGMRARADRPGVRRHEGQQRLGPVHGHPEGGGLRAGRSRRFPAARGRSINGGWKSSWPRSAAAGSIAGCRADRIFSTRRSPKGMAGGRQFPTAEAFSQYLITEHSICTVPWDDAGPYLRFSVTYEAADEAAEDALMAETEPRHEADRAGVLKEKNNSPRPLAGEGQGVSAVQECE